MSISPSPGAAFAPEPERAHPPAASPQWPNWFLALAIVALVVLGVLNGILFYELSDTRKHFEQQIADLKERSSVLERRVIVADEHHATLRGEVMMAQEKLGVTERDLSRARALAQQVREEQQQAAAKLGQQLGQVDAQVSSLREESGSKIAAVSGEVSSARTDIAATRKDLEQTKLQLITAIGEITKAHTLIARNHDELVELKRRGERNYFEFDLPKEKRPRRLADISVQLRSADAKKQRYSLLVIAEDSRTEKKDRTVNEPVQFYAGRSRALYEIVVNRVSKDRISGYLATPK